MSFIFSDYFHKKLSWVVRYFSDRDIRLLLLFCHLAAVLFPAVENGAQQSPVPESMGCEHISVPDHGLVSSHDPIRMRHLEQALPQPLTLGAVRATNQFLRC